MIHIKFFAYLRENLGQSSFDLEGHDGMTIADIKQALINKGEPWDLLAQEDILFAVNQSISAPTTIVNAGDELAFFPPVTGG